MNRIKNLSFNSDPDHNMMLVLNSMDVAEIVPTPDKYYTYVYIAKTPNIQYDQHPFIICTSVHRWGFIGFNFHWSEHRQYTWNEVQTNLYEIYEEEVNDMLKAPTAKFRIS